MGWTREGGRTAMMMTCVVPSFPPPRRWVRKNVLPNGVRKAVAQIWKKESCKAKDGVSPEGP